MNSEVFPKFAVFMNPLGIIVPTPISKKSIFGVITQETTSWSGATFWSLSMKFETSEPWLLTGVEKFLSGPPTLKMGVQNHSVRPIETELETMLFVLYHLNRTCSSHFKCVSINSINFCNEAFVVWLLF